MVGYTQQPVSYQRPPRKPEQKKSPWGDAGLAEIYEDLLSMPHTPEGIAKLQEYTQHEPPVSTLAGMVISNRNRILDASKQPPTSTVAQQNYEQAMASVKAPQMAGIGGGGGMPIDPNMISGQTARGIAATDPSTTRFPRDNTGIVQGEMDVSTAAGGGLIELAGGGEVIPFQNTGIVGTNNNPFYDPSGNLWSKGSPEYQEALKWRREVDAKAYEGLKGGIGRFITEDIPEYWRNPNPATRLFGLIGSPTDDTFRGDIKRSIDDLGLRFTEDLPKGDFFRTKKKEE